tara:strand:- start:19133 stop:19519 length:387 start_codon:yes stop_codon:yes gene_type:complete
MRNLFIALLFSITTLANTVDFVSPKDGEKVKSPFKVKMDVKGLKIRPAGEDANDKTTGHHHILIDMDAFKEGDAIPNDATHLHFGKGQTETEVTLPPGEHKLTLQFADGAHRSYGPKMSKTIKVTVVK